MDTKTSKIQSIDRVFFLIELLSQHPKGASLTDLCNESGLPKGTVSRMLSSLIAHGYAIQNIENKQYCLTMRLFEIGCRIVGGVNILSIARPHLEHLSSLTQQTVHLVSYDQDEVIYLYKEEVTSSIARMSSCVGLRNPMHCTGVGKSILAFLPTEEVLAIWERTKKVQYTPNTIMTFDRLQKELEEIRRNGYAFDNEEHEVGVKCIAAPIRDFHGSPLAAISLSAFTESFTDAKIQEYIPLLLDTADSISQYYGSGRLSNKS